jgi:hypothetical protein
MNKLYDLITFHNNTTPALNETNLNAMSQAIDDIDDRVIDLGAAVLETVPEILEKYTEIEALSENPPYIGANGNWFVWDTNTGAYVDSGVDASITVSVGTTSTLPAGSSATVTNSGTNTDPVLNFGIPKGDTGAAGADGVSPEVTITSITGGHTVKITDEDHPTGQSFNVMDGTVPITKYTQTLTAGTTSVTFTGVTTTANSIVEVATSVSGLEYNSISVSGTSYTVTFDSQASNVDVYLLVTEVA